VALGQKLDAGAIEGLARVAKDLSDFNTGDIVAAAGVGVRYRLSKENPVNYRIDYAYGKDGGNFSFSSVKRSDVRIAARGR